MVEVVLKQRSDGQWVIERADQLKSTVWNRAAAAGRGGWVQAHSRAAAKFELEDARKFCVEKGFEILEEIPNEKYLETIQD